MRNSHQNTTNYKEITNKEKLVLVRNGILYGLKFEQVKQEKATYNSGITTIPTMLFNNNNTQCFFDFTTQTNQESEIKITNFFSRIAPLTVFYVHNAFYYNTSTEEKADLSGEYVFTEFFNGIVKANVTSVETLATNVTRYDKKYFEEIPLLIMSSIPTTQVTELTIIRNMFGANTKNSFNYLGIQVGDFISLSGYPGKYEVVELSTDPNGIEILKIKGNITPNDSVDVKTMINVYISVSDNYTQEANLNEIEVGACVQTQNNVIIKCMDNHTISQCRFRSSFNDNIISTITPKTFCTTPETDTAVEISTTDKLVTITNLLASNIARATSSISNVAGPINRNGNSRTGFYGRG